jgi:DNA polymerase-3 subunit gamma/tau
MPPAPPSALALDTAIASWPAVLDLVRGENPMLAGALAAARPVSVGERELTLAFPNGASFLKRKAEQDEYRRVAAEALRTVTGHKVAFHYELRDDDQESEPAGEPALSGEELVRRFMEEFDAEELDVGPDEGEASG